MNALLDLRGVSRRFGGIWAVKDLDLAVDSGEVLGVIGPNGAGKSTLFALISGAFRPTEGRIGFAGKDVTGWSPEAAAAAGVARTFQTPRMFSSMTAVENVAVAAHLRHRSRRTALDAAARALDRVGLAAVRDQPAMKLSLPFRKRLEVARALATEPRILLLDEMMAGLSPAETAEAMAMVGDLKADGMTVMLVEHVMDVVLKLSTSVVVLDHGVKIAEGTPTSISRNPVVTAAYLGDHRGRATRSVRPSRDPGVKSARSEMLEVEDVHVDYTGAIAVSGVSLEVRRGEIVALVGSNGAGKTTILSAVAGIKKPSSGSIRFEGRPITGLAAHQISRRGVSLVPEGRELFARMSVERNLWLGAYPNPADATRRARLEGVHRLFPILAERRDQRAGTLSGGEQQMLAIARGLMADPRLLLLDEPTLGLGPILVERILESLPRIRDSGVAILLVEQHLERALNVADRGYVFRAGRIVLEGAASELLGSPEVRRAYLGV